MKNMHKSEKLIVDAALAPLEFFCGLGDDINAFELFRGESEKRSPLNSVLIRKLIKSHFSLFSEKYKLEIRYSLSVIILENRSEIFDMIYSYLLPFFVPEEKLEFFKDLWSVIFDEYDYADPIQIPNLSARTQNYKFRDMEEHDEFYDKLTWLIEM